MAYGPACAQRRLRICSSTCLRENRKQPGNKTVCLERLTNKKPQQEPEGDVVKALQSEDLRYDQNGIPSLGAVEHQPGPRGLCSAKPSAREVLLPEYQ